MQAKSRFYVASQYQVGKMIMKKYNDLKRTIEGASFSLGWEINPTNYWFYSRYYFLWIMGMSYSIKERVLKRTCSLMALGGFDRGIQ